MGQRVITGTEAADLGLITRCVEDPMAESVKVAKEVSHVPIQRQLRKNYTRKRGSCSRGVLSRQRQSFSASFLQVGIKRNFGVKIPYSRRKDIILDQTGNASVLDRTTYASFVLQVSA